MTALDLVRTRPAVATAERGVVVLGMHRSGTSAATRVVNLLGVPVCVADDLVPATSANPRGHWESWTLVRLNDELLRLQGGAWWCPPRPGRIFSAASVFADRLAAARRRFDDVHPTPQWVWKDPRTCLTLPFWLDALESQTLAVVVLRDPVEIAASLARRNAFAPAHSLALWERYLHHLLPSLEGLPVVVVRYEELLADPLAVADSARAFLAAHGIATVPPDEEELVRFVDPALRHESKNGRDELPWTPARRALVHVLADLPRTSDSFEAPALPVESPETDRLFSRLAHEYGLDRPEPARRRVRLTTSVVVVSRSEGPSLRRTVEALLATAPRSTELVVVDDASTDGSADFARRHPGVRLVRSEEPLGVARARNTGLAAAAGDVVVFADAHVLPRRGWLAPLLEQLAREEVAAAAPTLADMRTGRVRVHGLEFVDAALNVRWIPARREETRPVPLLCGCFLACRREVLDLVGGFDAGFAAYGGEDLELCLGLWRRGWECVVVPAAEVRHRWAGGKRQLDWEDFLHNLLRLGTLHLSPANLEQLTGCVAYHPAFAGAQARVLLGDAGARRAEIDALARFDDNWLFDRFGMKPFRRGEAA